MSLQTQYSLRQCKIHQYIIMSAPTGAQYGAIDGLRHCDKEVEEMRASYLSRRNFLVK